VPFIARWPGKVPAGKTDEQTLLSALDMFPTLCALAAAPLPNGVEFDGEDLSAALTGTPVARRKPLFWEYGRNTVHFRFPAAMQDRSPPLALRDGRWKLLVNADGSGDELFDLEADPRETTNVATGNPDVLRRLTTTVLDWRKGWPR
jgi:arylsulfatase A-like enzyme